MEANDEVIENGKKCFNNKTKGGWVTFPFIIGTVMGLTLATTGWSANMVVYAIEQYNMKEINAAKLYNIAVGGMPFLNIVGAVLADSFFGSFSIFTVASFVSLLGVIMFTFSATIPSLRPPSCTTNMVICKPSSPYQQGFLYATIAVSVIGSGVASCLLGTIGAGQFPNSSEHQRIFFNWYLLAHQLGEVLGSTFIVYVQSNVSWGLGFGIGVVANTIAIVVFLFGSCLYRRVKPQGGSPFTSIARVLIASARKLKTNLPAKVDINCYFHGTSTPNVTQKIPSNSLRCLNRAALITVDKDAAANESHENTKSWNLCTVEEVEDLKRSLKVFPILSAGIGFSIRFGVCSSLVVLQALVMDRSMLIFILISTCLGIVILDRIMYPLMQKTANRSLTPLECIGIGYFLIMLSAVAFALVEKKRLKLVKTHLLLQQANAMAPMSVFWLVSPLGLLGLGSGFSFSSLMQFYYQELPASLKNTANAMIGLQFATGSYLSTVVLS